MQRVRIGLTGLACVFLLVLLAAAFFGLANHEQATGPLIVSPSSGLVENAVVETPHEPLAELGVAPGLGGDVVVTNNASNSATNTVAVAPPPTAGR